MAKISDIVYGQGETDSGDIDLEGDLYTPESPPQSSSAPLVIFFHGGGFSSGNRGGADIIALADTLTEYGFYFLDCDYRTEVNDPIVSSVDTDGSLTTIAKDTWSVSTDNGTAAIAALIDMGTAVRWAKANAATYSFDTSKIVVSGHSAGGITAVSYALWNDTTFLSTHSSNNITEDNSVAAALSFSGGSKMAEEQDKARSTSAPIMFWHGMADTNTYAHYDYLEPLKVDISAASGSYTSYEVPGGGHTDWDATLNGLTLYETTRNWLVDNIYDPRVDNPHNRFSQTAF